MSTKIEALVDGSVEAFRYANRFAREPTSGPERLCIGIPEGQDRCLVLLARTLAGPFKLLYIPHTTRIGAALGRYEGPEMERPAVEQFLSRFGSFLNEDARHDFWLHSRPENATIVLDRHNLIYAYGPMEGFERVLESAGIQPGPRPIVPDPHVHHYHSEWDESERAILDALPWRITPLQKSDMQIDAGSSAG